MIKLIQLILVGLFTTFSLQAQPPKKTSPALDHIALYVVDLKASAKFYKDIIGLDSIAEPFKDNKHAWFDIGNGIALHIIAGADQRKSYFKNQHTCFRVPDVAAFTKILSKHNISWEDRDGAKMKITTRVDKVKQLWLQDPDGYWVEINDNKID